MQKNLVKHRKIYLSTKSTFNGIKKLGKSGCPMIREWLNKQCCMNVMEYYCTIKKDNFEYLTEMEIYMNCYRVK